MGTHENSHLWDSQHINDLFTKLHFIIYVKMLTV